MEIANKWSPIMEMDIANKWSPIIFFSKTNTFRDMSVSKASRSGRFTINMTYLGQK